jgi:steroid 5-alpha reductase family enzyme
MRVVLAINLVLLFGFMSLMFLVARRRQRLDTVDVAWGLGFVMVAWTAALYSPTTRSLVVALLVSVWGLRLASHIHRRSKLRGDDPRYQELSAKWSEKFGWHSYVWVFLLQGGLIWMADLARRGSVVGGLCIRSGGGSAAAIVSATEKSSFGTSDRLVALQPTP